MGGIKRAILVLLALGLPVMGFAGHEAGGGHVVVCQNALGVTHSIELLDYYEAEQLWSITRDLSEATTYQSKVELALSRLRKIDPVRANRYEAEFKTFEQNAQREKGITLTDIPDTGNLALPKGCKVQQMITQHRPQFPEDHRFLIDEDMWESPVFDEDNKAGIILHELIYHQTMEEGQEDARTARYFNVYLTSRKLDQMVHMSDYVSLLNEVGFQTFSFDDILFNLTSDKISYYPDGKIQSILAYSAPQAVIDTQTVKVTTLQFSEKGKLATVEAQNIDYIPLEFPMGTRTLETGHLFDGLIGLDDEGRIVSFESGTEIDYQVQGQNIAFDPWRYTGPMLFYPSGALKEGAIFLPSDEKPPTLMTTSGPKSDWKNDEILDFDENGIVTGWKEPKR